MNSVVVGLIGNPNCGKTTLFNALTGSRQKVGNWPGVTVDRKSGLYTYQEQEVQVIDLPGTYSLDTGAMASLDEGIARDYVLSGEASFVVNIVDASNLERNLYLTIQLIEMRVPVIVALNMLDVAEESAIQVQVERLAQALGCPVIPLVASRGRGVEQLRECIFQRNGATDIHTPEVTYAPRIEEALSCLEPLVAPVARDKGVEARWLAVKLLEDDARVTPWFSVQVLQAVQAEQEAIEEQTGEEADVWVADARYGFIHQVVQAAVTRRGEVRRSITDRIDQVVLNRYLGIPLFLGIMYLLFVISFNGGNILLDFFDQAAQLVFVQTPAHYLSLWGAPGWLISLVTSVGSAIDIVSTFIAPIGMTFLFLSLLEDSGYMARAAFVMDRFMRRIGLTGKAFVPMVVGFGCNVPAVMATRTLEDRRERLVAALIQPFMSCSARLVVYMAFVAVFFRQHGGQLVFGLYVLGMVAAVMTALILKRTALKGDASPFVMELPRYHIPTLGGIARTTWDRLSVFLLRVGKVIIVAAVVVNVLGSITIDHSGIHSAPVKQSLLADAGRAVTPVFHPMGISQDNWPATVGLLSGVVVKEIVVGTLNNVYDRMSAQPDYAAPLPFGKKLGAALATIPANARAFVNGLLDPLGFAQIKGAESSVNAASASTGASQNTLSAMGRLFSESSAVAYLIFVLLYIPCINTMAAIRRETGSRTWTAFATAWGIGLGYCLAVGYYQVATLTAHPVQSVIWVAALLAALGLSVLGLSRFGDRLNYETLPVR